MIIIQQDFNKVPLCLEGTKENSPFAVSGPALVFVVVSGITPVLFFWKNENGWSTGKWSGSNADLAVDLVEGQRKYVTKAKEIWNKGKGNMEQRQRIYVWNEKDIYVSPKGEICDKWKGYMWQTKCTKYKLHFMRTPYDW